MANSQHPNKARSFESLYEDMQHRLSKNLFEQVVRTQSLQPTWSLSKIIAIAVAIVLHLLVAGLGLIGLFLLVTGWPNPIAILGALICFGIVWFIAPRFPQPRGYVLSRGTAPALYEIADRIASTLNTKPIDKVVIDWNFNAAYSVVGWQQKKTVCLGLPLLCTLNEQERVALLAHELAHGVNGDPARGFFVGGAIHMLQRWQTLLTPDRSADNGHFGIIVLLSDWISNVFMRVAALIPQFFGWVLIRLYWRESQRAEYLADHLAASVSGTDAMLSMLGKLDCGGDNMLSILHRGVVARAEIDLFQELSKLALLNAPSNREAQPDSKDSSIDTTHPPAHLRVAFLKTRRIPGAKLMISSSDWKCVDQELMPLRQDIQLRLMDMYEQGLYY